MYFPSTHCIFCFLPETKAGRYEVFMFFHETKLFLFFLELQSGQSSITTDGCLFKSAFESESESYSNTLCAFVASEWKKLLLPNNTELWSTDPYSAAE